MKRIRMIGLCLLTLALVSVQSAAGAATGAFREFPVPGADFEANIERSGSITSGPDGNVWFRWTTPAFTVKVDRITPSGKISEVAPLHAGTVGALSGGGPHGNLWLVALGAPLIEKGRTV